LFTSSSTVKHYAEAVKTLDLSGHKNPLFGSIGVRTTETLKDYAMPVGFESPKANLEHFVVETISHFKK
jgi:uroporphyrinogen-III synthase